MLVALPAGPLAVRALLAVGAVAVAALLAREPLDRRAKALVGARAERDVGRMLASRPGTTVLHGVMVGPRADADHVVVGPGVWVVETKSGGGPISIGDGGRIVAGGKQLRGQPHRQALRSARQVSELVGLPCTPVVCIPAGQGIEVVDGVLVCGPDLLVDHLASADRLSEEEARRAVRLLASRVDGQ